MSLGSYFYDKCPDCGGLVTEGLSDVSGVGLMRCEDCGKLL